MFFLFPKSFHLISLHAYPIFMLIAFIKQINKPNPNTTKLSKTKKENKETPTNKRKDKQNNNPTKLLQNISTYTHIYTHAYCRFY